MSVTREFECDVDTLYELLSDPQFLVDRCLGIGELSAECEVEQEGEDTVIHLMREVERDLPKVLAKLFDPVQMLKMTERWREDGDSWRGDWTIEVQGQPVTIYGDFSVVPTESGCRYSVSHRASAKVPLVGKQVEKYILSQTAQGASDELDYALDSLSG